MYLPVEPNLDDLYKETIDVKSSELVALKCRVAGDSYVINDGKCGETLIMKPFLSDVYKRQLFGFASKGLDPIKDLDEQHWNSLGIKTRYYNTELHKGCLLCQAM